MKTHGHYETLSVIKQARELVGSIVGDKAHSHKVRRIIIRCKKRYYRFSRPKRTRRIYDYEN